MCHSTSHEIIWRVSSHVRSLFAFVRDAAIYTIVATRFSKPPSRRILLLMNTSPATLMRTIHHDVELTYTPSWPSWCGSAPATNDSRRTSGITSLGSSCECPCMTRRNMAQQLPVIPAGEVLGDTICQRRRAKKNRSKSCNLPVGDVCMGRPIDPTSSLFLIHRYTYVKIITIDQFVIDIVQVVQNCILGVLRGFSDREGQLQVSHYRDRRLQSTTHIDICP